MKRVFCIGETLIDFIPVQKEKSLKEVTSFERVAGGAPMNVAIAIAKYGGDSVMLTKIANDSFGDYLVDVLEGNGVDTSYIIRCNEGETGLAFVSVDKSGERDFSFYRKNSADLLLLPNEVKSEWFDKGDLLHFCSVDLVESPMKQTHIKVINSFRKMGGIVSFDPNVRLPLWPDKESCGQTIVDFLPLADIVKVSDEELLFITNIRDEKEAISSLFVGNVKVVVYTKGKDGAIIYLKNGEQFEDKGFKVTVSDTTGAGDAFIGGFLSELLSIDISSDNICQKVSEHHQQLLTFANASGALTASVKGAIHAAPGKQHIMNFIATQRGRLA
ncbi:carbohydrate kinase [Priestia megaterium]|uniref:carbohydrate kinase family protein n=1 Tax=Priestia megaterium TaxID=1404 RepID=UPI000BF46E6D|nr:carbohydrate kinase [Priestia megaterium]PFP09317.1 carbohydrate kinase [Priestia megaterium]PFU63497.1 carbohydrate kinase [Priestia megaterium]